MYATSGVYVVACYVPDKKEGNSLELGECYLQGVRGCNLRISSPDSLCMGECRALAELSCLRESRKRSRSCSRMLRAEHLKGNWEASYTWYIKHTVPFPLPDLGYL